MSYLIDSYKSSENLKKGLPKEKEDLVIQYIPLVKYVVGRMSVNLPPGMDRTDLISIGSWGLIDAAMKFNAAKGVKFKTYAMTRVRGAILDDLRRQSLGGQALCRKAQMLEKAFTKLEREQGRPATEAEVAIELELTEEKIHKMVAEVNGSFQISLDDTISGEDDTETRVSTIEDKKSDSTETRVFKKEQKSILAGAINVLPDKERLVVSLYYYEELTLKEIAKILEVSESRVSQIHSKAILHLKAKLKNNV